MLNYSLASQRYNILQIFYDTVFYNDTTNILLDKVKQFPISLERTFMALRYGQNYEKA